MLGEHSPPYPRNGGTGDWSAHGDGVGEKREGHSQTTRCLQWGCPVSCVMPQGTKGEGWAGVSNTGPLPQHHPLPGVGDVPDDGAAGPGEAGRLASHLHHLHPQWHHGQPGQCHLPTLQGRGEGLGALSQILSAPRAQRTPLSIPMLGRGLGKGLEHRFSPPGRFCCRERGRGCPCPT